MLKSTIDRAAGSSPWRRLGKIKLGIKVKSANGSEYPKDLDYFVVPEKYQAQLGAQPKELAIILAHPTLAENFTTKAAWYQGNGARVCHTQDEVQAQRWMAPQGQPQAKKQWCTISCPGTACEYRADKRCQARGYFSFMLPATGEVGTFVMIFGSTVAQDRIYTALKTIEQLVSGRPQGLAGLRMLLRREPVEFYKDLKGTGEQSKVVKYIPSLEINFANLLPQDHNLLAPFFGKGLVALPAAPQTLDGDLEVDEDDDKDKDPHQDDEIPFDGSGPGGAR
jgi:hypothetical protein